LRFVRAAMVLTRQQCLNFKPNLSSTSKCRLVAWMGFVVWRIITADI
jgi:hypothetical protein